VTAANPGIEPAPAPDGGTQPQPESPWSSLPEDIRSNPALSKHQNVESLAKEYVNLQSVVGRKGVLLPKEGDEADRTRFWRELGVPEKVEDYGAKDIPVPEGLPWDSGFADQMLGEMHKANLTKDQAKAVYESYLKLDADRWGKHMAAQEQAAGETSRVLRQEWGVAYNQNLSMAGKAFNAVFGGDFSEIDQIVMADGRRLGDDPRFLKAMLSVGKRLGEDSLLVSGGTSAAKILGPDEAKREWDTLLADKDFVKDLYDKTAPGHDAALSKQDSLFRMMHPQAKEGR
jgi:hypothetical protein